MRKAIVSMFAIAALAMVVPAHADHACEGGRAVTVPGAGDVPAHYVVHDDPSNPHGGIWIYEESNGEPGLQRNDESCSTTTSGDAILF